MKTQNSTRLIRITLRALALDLSIIGVCTAQSTPPDPTASSEITGTNRSATHPGHSTSGGNTADQPAKAAQVAPHPTPSEVRRIDDDQLIVGGVTLRKSTREISFDARVNQTGGLIEFLLVTEKGKIHESLFSCAISPIDLNVAFKLLDYPSSPELFQIRTPEHRPTGKYPEVAEEVKNGARLSISASWQSDGSEKTLCINELVKNTKTGELMPPGPWLYTGSLIANGRYLAETSGDIIAVFTSSGAMVNYPGNERTNDEVWFVSQGKLPAKHSPVRITVKPFSNVTPAIQN